MRVRESFRIRGLVQGVGFRPTVWNTARRLKLAGDVYNDSEGVVVNVEGEEASVASFARELRRDVARDAPLARIDALVSLGFSAPTGATDFEITASREGAARTTVTPDAATCAKCASEIFTKTNRRWRYAFTNCTHCGPRHTITRHIPYDRAQTSMAVFPMCPVCRAEYENPADRRFHAQPNACPVCGPKLTLTDNKGNVITGDAIAGTLKVILTGGIAAVKGLGGFHLVCDARNSRAVTRLRERKGRSEKPLAVMCANTESASELVRLSAAGVKALTSFARPIVLAPKTEAADRLLAPGVAGGFSEVGVMLPYTPVHLLLFHEYLGQPETDLAFENRTVDLTLVMTSANPGGEPLVTGNEEAYGRLMGIADVFLLHNRDIVVRCDDSVVRDTKNGIQTVRRARGYTPLALPFPADAADSILATGPFLKNTACITRGKEAFVTEHIGDTDNESTCRALAGSVKHFLNILEVSPGAVACDLHPDFYSTHLAEDYAQRLGIPLIPVQHHHAHAAAVMGEHGVTNDAWALVADGVGYGTDGTAWGGELLHVHTNGTFDRIGHLETMALPGFDKAAREPRRMGAVMCLKAGRSEVIETLWPAFTGQPVRELIKSPRLSGRTTSLGRLFDAAAAVLGLVEVMHDEAYAAMRLESEAVNAQGRVQPHGWTVSDDNVLSFTPLFAELIDRHLAGDNTGQCAADFEATVAAGLSDWVSRVVPAGETVCLAGGSFLNRVLAESVPRRLREHGLTVYMPQSLPPGDGAVSYGEALVAAQILKYREMNHVSGSSCAD